MISPTGKGIRNDAKGLGHYGAPRGKKKHKGVDYLCATGQPVLSPISGKIERIAYPYADKSYSGIVIRGRHISIKMFYLKPMPMIGEIVLAGELVGYAQDISKKKKSYLGMLPHIHLEIESIDPELLMKLQEISQKL